MYSPGDAVAKIDGYIISITGGTKYVGEKHLVRIDEVGRTAAVASLLDVPAGENGAPGDELESKPRRRGRRGGRRRSGAKAGSATGSSDSE
jgi:ribonuclease G